MPRKRIYLNVEHLAPGIELIRKEIKTVIAAIAKTGLTAGKVPFRPRSGFHDSEMAYIVDSALLMLHADMKNLSEQTWERYRDTYLAIPTDNAATGAQPGVAFIIFYTDGEPSMTQLANEIADYIEAFVETKIPYLKMGGSTSYKVVGSLALIHAEEKLKEKTRDQSSEEIS